MNKGMFSVLLLLIFGVMGCAILQETPPVKIQASRLSCGQNPEMVDGDIDLKGAAIREVKFYGRESGLFISKR